MAVEKECQGNNKFLLKTMSFSYQKEQKSFSKGTLTKKLVRFYHELSVS